MTNPSNAVGTNGAFGGRTSVNAINDNLAIYASRGVVSGWACVPDTDMTVALGGNNEQRDVAVAEDAVGNRTTIDNISQAPVQVTLNAAPATNSRIDAIVAYVDNPPMGEATVLDNPGACGLIAVSGSIAANPSAPNEAAIRTAITADGASGTTAYYVVLATVTVASGTTTITADAITAGSRAMIMSDNIPFTKFSTDEQVIGVTDDGDKVYRKKITYTSQTSLMTWSSALATGIKDLINIYGSYNVNGNKYDIPRCEAGGSGGVESISYYVNTSGSLLEKHNFTYASDRPCTLYIEYTKLD